MPPKQKSSSKPSKFSSKVEKKTEKVVKSVKSTKAPKESTSNAKNAKSNKRSVDQDVEIVAKKQKLETSSKPIKSKPVEEEFIQLPDEEKKTKKPRKAKAKSPSPVSESESEGGFDQELEIVTDSSASESESDSEDEKEIALSKAEETTMKQQIALAKPSGKPGVVYIGRIPHGFYEDQMRAYFSQFGDVSKLRLSRNRKTGKSKHYAFIEFKSAEVAKIVAETMNNYLMLGHLLKCEFHLKASRLEHLTPPPGQVIPPERVHPGTFEGANKKFKVIPWASIHRRRHNKEKTEEQRAKIVEKLLTKEEAKRAKLKELGIDYDFPGYAGNVKQPKMLQEAPVKVVKEKAKVANKEKTKEQTKKKVK